MFETGSVFIFALEAAAAVGVLMFIWRWGRTNNRFAVGMASTAAGVIVWNLVLNHTLAWGFLNQAGRLRVSWQDAGTGVFVFSVTALAFGLGFEPNEPSRRVATAALIAGLTAALMDVFLL